LRQPDAFCRRAGKSFEIADPSNEDDDMKSLAVFSGGAIAAVAIALVATGISGPATAEGLKVPPATVVEKPSGKREVAVLAGGCFWGVEGVYEHVDGVIDVTSGYAGGGPGKADYASVSSGRTGKAEAVRIVFDPSKVSYAELLRILFSVVADPTQVNRQGPDVGTQYRTTIFPQSPSQARVARAYLAQLSKARVFDKPIATRVEATGRFAAAEAYHQDFMRKNPAHPYILAHDRPKVAALRRVFPGHWRA
jgi:peptide-methionine (S)-S-oxide reductase